MRVIAESFLTTAGKFLSPTAGQDVAAFGRSRVEQHRVLTQQAAAARYDFQQQGDYPTGDRARRCDLADRAAIEVAFDGKVDFAQVGRTARQRYLKSVPCWTSKDVADAARHVNKNASSTAHRWKSDDKIFAIPAAGKRDVYPAFQFKDGKPREVIAELLKVLEEARTPWEIAQWFVTANSWLDGDRPIDLLDDPESRDLLIDAAEQEVATNVG